MSLHHLTALALLLSLGSAAFVQAAPVPAAKTEQPPPAPDPNNPASQYSVNQNIGDWVVRCVLTTVKSPAPCDMLQLTVNKDNQQRISSFSITWVPSRDTYALQVVVPNGIALAKGLNLAAGEKSLNGARFTRCERDGCYMETLAEPAMITALQGIGDSTTITVVTYGTNNEIKLPVSLKGFKDALDRMKQLAKDRAVPLPANVPLNPPRG